MTSCYPDSMIRAFGEDARPNAVNDRARVLMICLYMPALASERGCPIRTQPLPQLPAWPCKTNSNAPLRRRAELPCIVLLESKHHRLRWPIVDAASGDCSFLLGCCDSSLRLRLLRCIMPLQLSRREQHTSRLAGLEVDASGTVVASIALTTRRTPSRNEFGRRHPDHIRRVSGDDLMRQTHASLRLLAAAHDSCLDGVAARRRSFLRGHLIFAFATFGWAITLHLNFGTTKILYLFGSLFALYRWCFQDI